MCEDPGPAAEGKGALSTWNKVSAAGALLASLAPLIVDWVSEDLIPPWPSGAAKTATGIGIAAALVALAIALRRPGRPRVWPVIALSLAALLVLTYFFMVRSLVVKVDESTVIVKGFGLTGDASTAAKANGHSSEDTKWLLGHFGYESEAEIWNGHAAAEASLFAIFCTAVSCFAGGLTGLVPRVKRCG